MIPFNYLGPVFKAFASFIYPRKFKEELRGVARQLREEGAVLDIGSGTGILSTFIERERGDLRFSLLDPAPGMLKYAPRSMARIRGRAEYLPFPDNIFEAVVIGDALHHFDDPERVIYEIYRVLKDGGFLIIFEIDPDTRFGSGIRWGERMFGEPARFYAPEKLTALLPEDLFEYRISRFDWRYAMIARKKAQKTSSQRS
ncbi:MAG: class I SAM-dependent methyltransferase [Syntrophorhabdaceae bacterium]